MLLTHISTALISINQLKQTHTVKYPLWMTISIMLIIGLPCFTYADEPSKLLTNDTINELTTGIALDSDGLPITLPSTNKHALNYHSTISQKQQKSPAKTTNKKRKKKSKKLTRKQQLASRNHVANDPSCRWIDRRMDQLELGLSYAGNNTGYGYHSRELKIRQNEWKCMKCGAEGPSQSDHDSCQYRR